MNCVCAVKRSQQMNSIPETESYNKRTTLLDLPDFCLDKLLCPLTLKELAVVANSNNYLKDRAICVFKLNKFPQTLHTEDFSQTEHHDFASILKAFGTHINEITIKSDDSQKFIDALVEHCSQSLTELWVKFTETSDKGIVINRPFVNLKILHYYFNVSSYDKFWLTKINQLFPMLSSLSIYIWKPIPQIEKLLVYNMKYLTCFHLHSYAKNCNKLIAFNFLRVNPQLYLVSISKNGADNTFGKTGMELLNISSLRLSTMEGKLSLRYLMELKELRDLDISAGICYTHINNLKLPHLYRLNIELIGNVNIIWKFIAKCHSLATLSININRKPFNLSDIVDQMPSTISILSLTNGTNLSLLGVKNLKKLSSLNISAEEYPGIQHVDLPQLKNLVIKFTKDMESIIMFIEKCQNLTELTLNFGNDLSLSSSHIESLTEPLMNLNRLNSIVCNGVKDENFAKSLQSIPRRRNESTNARKRPRE